MSSTPDQLQVFVVEGSADEAVLTLAASNQS